MSTIQKYIMSRILLPRNFFQFTCLIDLHNSINTYMIRTDLYNIFRRKFPKINYTYLHLPKASYCADLEKLRL